MYRVFVIKYVYTYAINYVDIIRTNSRISREIRTCSVYVCLYCKGKLYRYVHCVQDIDGFHCRPIDVWNVRMVDHRWRMKNQYLFNSHYSTPGRSGEKMNSPSVYVRLFPTVLKYRTYLSCTFGVCVFVCVRAHACARMCWCVCIPLADH